jgi:hypothetical protein
METPTNDLSNEFLPRAGIWTSAALRRIEAATAELADFLAMRAARMARLREGLARTSRASDKNVTRADKNRR